MAERRPSPAHHLHEQVEAVNDIRLVGAPHTLLLDEAALLSADGTVPSSIGEKLAVLSQHEGMHLVIRSSRADALEHALLALPHLLIVSSIQDARWDGPALAIIREPVPLPPHVYAWYVGSGGAPAPFHSTRHSGVQATDEILALFGTAQVQERAGIAFRAAGAGKEIPREAPFDPKILDGIATAVTNHPRQVGQLQQRLGTREELDLDRDTERLIAAALPPVLASQDTNGAVGAAPPPQGPDEPNYWFFWQRDAGQVVLAMVHVTESAADAHARDSARSFVAKYLDFVQQLPRHHGTETADLGVSRFDMSGRPIKGYGNPQKDGPAHTVLATVAALGESERAYAVSKPYLEYLDQHILGASFDPWECAAGEIFFDYNLGRRALRVGARLARTQRDDAAAERYRSRADEVEHALEAFKDAARGYVLAGRKYLQPFLNTTSRLDIGVVGSVLTAYDVKDPVLNVEDPLIEHTMQALERVCAERWPVNVAWTETGHAGMGMGRFPEDANDGIGSTGGNPWTFATLWAAQYYLRLVQRRDFLGTEDAGGRQRAELLEKADGYLEFVLSHVSPEALTEQIDGQAGRPRGAKKLAWAQAALIQHLLLRQEVRGASGGWRSMRRRLHARHVPVRPGSR